MRCRQAETLISLVLDDVAAEYQRQQLAEHLSRCEHCRVHEEVLRRGREGLRQGLVDPPNNFEWKLALKIQKALRDGARGGESAPAAHSFWTPALVSALVVAFMVVGVGLFSLQGRRGSPGSPNDMTASPVLLVDAAEQPDRDLDLSGAVPAGRLEVDLRGSDFGIRTVGGVDPLAGSLFGSDWGADRRPVALRPTSVRHYGSVVGGWTPVTNPTLRLRFQAGRLSTRSAIRDTAGGRQ